MLSKFVRDRVLEELANQYNVHDAYWHKDRLYVINSWDLGHVQEYIETSNFGEYITYQHVEEDEPIYEWE